MDRKQEPYAAKFKLDQALIHLNHAPSEPDEADDLNKTNNATRRAVEAAVTKKLSPKEPANQRCVCTCGARNVSRPLFAAEGDYW